MEEQLVKLGGGYECKISMVATVITIYKIASRLEQT